MTMKPNCRNAIFALAFLALAGCGTTPPSKLYVIDPVVEGDTSIPQSSLAVLIQEVALRAYLSRKELLRRDQNFQVSVSEFERWAEPLHVNTTIVLAENLSRLLQSDNIVAYPWQPAESINYEIAVEVYAFGPGPSGDVVLNARWTILDGSGVTVASERALFAASAASGTPVDTVAAMSSALGNLSREIASRLQRLADDAGTGTAEDPA